MVFLLGSLYFFSFFSHGMKVKILLFDRLFVSHYPYIKFFDQSRVDWLPCCFARYGIDRYCSLILEDKGVKNAKYDFVFPFKPYQIGSRNTVAAAIEKKIKNSNTKFYLGEVESGEPYMKLLQASRVILNVSLTDDLNIRNFEAWAFNRILLTNLTPDHNRIHKLPSNTLFFNRNLNDFELIMDKALKQSVNSVNSSSYVLNNHMQIHRYVQIINQVLDTDFSIQTIDFQKSDAILQKSLPPAKKLRNLKGNIMN